MADREWRCQHGTVRRGYATPTASCDLRSVSPCNWVLMEGGEESSRSELAPPKISERQFAAALQDLAEESRGVESDGMHRQILARDSGWVEIQGEYLAHLLGRIEYEAANGGGG